MAKRFFKLVVAYDGRAYVGWQVQPNGRTVQAEIEHALQHVIRQSIRITASGRTDAGVHALGQAVSFSADTDLDPPTLQRALNGNLPKDIRILRATYAVEDFHAIRDAISKRYRYFIQDGGVQDPFLSDWSWYVPKRLDEASMQAAADLLVGEHDFASYQSAGSPRATTVRKIEDFVIDRRSGQLCDPVVVEVAADGFLYNMVRNLVGTLVDVGLGKNPPTWPHEILASKDRKLAGPTAPAHGLFLVSVEYDPATEIDA